MALYSLSMHATSHIIDRKHKNPYSLIFCIHEFGSNIHLGCEGLATPQSLLEVRIGLDMMINLKRHLDSSVLTAIQKHLS